ncbi:MAG: BMP family lipoprotein [Chloroflexota bacterium]
MHKRLTALLGAALIFLLAGCLPELPGNPGVTTTPAATRVTGVTAVVQNQVPATTATPTPAPTSTPAPTPTPTQLPIVTPVRRAYSVALIESQGIDLGRGALARQGLERAARELNLETYTLITPPADLASNAMRLAEAGYNLVVIATPYPQVAAFVAERYPGTRFVVFGPPLSKQTGNVANLVYAEDQAGFLAGALAGWLTQHDMVGFVGAEWTLEIVKFRKGYEHGVQYVNRLAPVLGNYVHSFEAPARGRAEALAQLDEGVDVLFVVGGTTAQGAMTAAADRGYPFIGAEADAYPSYQRLAPLQLSTALVRYDVGVYDAVKAAAQNAWQAGARVYDAGNGAVGLGAFHDWETRVPDEAKRQLQQIYEGLQKGTIKTDVRT